MKSKTIFIFIAAIVLVFGLFFFLAKNSSKAKNLNAVPNQPIHWHPHLRIIIKGQERVIPPGIGINTGNNIDNELSSMGMAPTHTHTGDGIIHMENDRPWQKPETLTLGYFFKVWGKNFNSSCVFEYCNGENGNLTITVNGRQNYEFNRYIMHDKDEILIEYK